MSRRALLRVVFLYVGALFYGHVLGQLRRERARADRGFAWARELEAKVAERTEELQRLYEECLAANRLKSELIAGMSHELRTPLHIMMGYTELLLDGDPGRTSAERDKMVVRIREASHGLLQLVDDVLDLRKLESGRVPLEIEPVHLPRFIGHFQRRERMAVAPNVALRWRIDPALPEIETDVAKLSIVLDNLVNNAIKFTRKGTITVSASDVVGKGPRPLPRRRHGPWHPEGAPGGRFRTLPSGPGAIGRRRRRGARARDRARLRIAARRRDQSLLGTGRRHELRGHAALPAGRARERYAPRG